MCAAPARPVPARPARVIYPTPPGARATGGNRQGRRVNLPVSEPKPFLPGGGPEGLFRVDDLSVGDAPHGRMITGPWMTGPDGRPSPGGLGVLVDDVLGYAILAARPRNDWSVSTEIALDVLGPVPGDGS